jgi:fructose-1,6-bisphosphatase II
VGSSIHAIAEALGMPTSELTVVVQDRPRHKYLLEEIREAGAGISLIDSGSLSASFEIMFRPNGRLHVLWGTFGAPEGVVLAFMARAAGCGFLGRVMPHNARAEREAKELQLEGRTLRHDEFVQGEGVLVMSGVHSSTWLRGVETVRGESGVSMLSQTVVLGLDGAELCLHRNGEFTESTPYRFPR